MADMSVVRAETADDHAAIARVVEAAFGSPVEARLVEAIRASENYVPEWALVAVRADDVVGHVMVSYITLRDGDATHLVPSLSPLAVAPDVQRGGIGSALVRAVTARVDAAGEPLVVLEGSPLYYSRLGFEFAGKYGITFDLPDWAPPAAAQAMPLRSYDPAVRGHVVYPPAFTEALE